MAVRGTGVRFGDAEIRVDGRAKVSGRMHYTADLRPPDLLWAAFLKSPHPHARIVAIDVRAAEAVPGVRAVLTGERIGPHYFGRRLADWPVLAVGKVRFIGDRVAAVAAETREAAEEACRRIEVTYEELPALLDPLAAIEDDAPLVHDDPGAYAFGGGGRPAPSHPNVQGERCYEKGDPGLVVRFASAYRVFEHRFRTARQHHGFIEPHASLVSIDAAGVVHVQTPCKAPFRLREQFAVVTGLPREQIVIEPSAIGGDFGGKGLAIEEFGCYFLARATGRPVKAVMTYADELGATSHRHAAHLRLRTGVDVDGNFLVHEAEVVYDGGAYAAAKPTPGLLPGGTGFATIAYRVPHARVSVRTVYTNAVPGGHMRAPADVQTLFAWESHVDMIARELGMDPLDLRLRNVILPGETALAGEAIHDVRGREVLEALRRESAWDEPPPLGRGRGVGFACRHTGGGKTAVKLELDAAGDVTILSAVPDQGAGIATVATRVAAEALGIDAARIAFRRGNTAETLADPGAGGSRSTHIVGRATQRAAEELRRRLDAGETAPLAVVGSYDGEHTAEHPADHSFSAYAVEVEVDAATGAVRVVDACIVADVGTVINPVAHQGQIDGGFVYGLGGALMEAIELDGGKPDALGLGDYKLPTIADVPPLRTYLLTGAHGAGPFGAKGAGELSNTSVAPAVANAVAAACGARVTELPITAERVYDALTSAW